MHFIDRITHTTAFVIPVVEHWLEREIPMCGNQACNRLPWLISNLYHGWWWIIYNIHHGAIIKLKFNWLYITDVWIHLWNISHSSQCSTTGVQRTCINVSIGWCIYKRYLIVYQRVAVSFLSHYLSGPLSCLITVNKTFPSGLKHFHPLPYGWHHITKNKMCWVHH